MLSVVSQMPILYASANEGMQSTEAFLSMESKNFDEAECHLNTIFKNRDG